MQWGARHAEPMRAASSRTLLRRLRGFGVHTYFINLQSLPQVAKELADLEIMISHVRSLPIATATTRSIAP